MCQAICNRFSAIQIISLFNDYASIPDVARRALIDRLRVAAELPFGAAGLEEGEDRDADDYAAIEQLPLAVWTNILEQGVFSYRELALLSTVSKTLRYTVSNSDAAFEALEAECHALRATRYGGREAARFAALLGMAPRQLRIYGRNREPIRPAIASYLTLQRLVQPTVKQIEDLLEDSIYTRTLLLRLCRDDAERTAKAREQGDVAAKEEWIVNVVKYLLDPDTELADTLVLRDIGLYALLPETLEAVDLSILYLTSGQGRNYTTEEVAIMRERLDALIDGARCWADPEKLRDLKYYLHNLSDEASPAQPVTPPASAASSSSDPDEDLYD